MHELRSLLEELTVASPADVPVAEVHRRIRQRLRRRRAATVATAALGVAGVAVMAAGAGVVDEGQPLRPTLLASASSPAGASATRSGPCATPSGFPSEQSIAELRRMTWPSGARAASVSAPGPDRCVLTIVLAVPSPVAQDVAAARARWGDHVVLEGLNTGP